MLRRVDAGEAAGAAVANRIAPFAVGPHKAAGLDGQRAAQQREAHVLPLAGALAIEQRRRHAIGE